jgi:DNA-directed RNA polymerase specialized sigma24 family protein
MAIMDALDQGETIQADFQKFVSSIVRNKRSDWMHARWYKNPEDKFCELAKENEEGEVEEFDQGYPRNIVEERQLVAEVYIDKRLDTVRASLIGKDAELFDSLRHAQTLHEAAQEMGISYDAVKQRVCRLRRRTLSSLEK